MGRMSDPDDIDILLGTKKAPKAPSPVQHASRSSADDVLDVVGGGAGTPNLACDGCKSKNVKIIGNGVSGQQKVRCLDCGHKAPWSTRIHFVKDLNNRRPLDGPYRRTVPLEKPDRHTPRYRSRGKPMTRNEDDE